MTSTDCPSFVDLVALAAKLAPDAGTEPFGSGARMVPVRAGPCEVFVTTVAAGEGTHVEDGGDTWIFVRDGTLTLEVGSQRTVIGPGTSAVIAKGTALRWHAAQPLSIIGMRYLNAAEEGKGISVIDNAAPLTASNPPADDVLTSEKPSCRSHNVFRSASGEFQCGTWDSTPYQRIPIFFRHSELMHLLEGEVTFTDEAGRTGTFRKGDTFIIEQGARCSWASFVHVAKIYAQFKPAA
ncbi:cupin domain-containing protein [Niveispirillum irakense]|uniref:cupin domain-containing protein n=1 Tax=Niveispirillum irakense TaxID=34011 RepID=UPI000413A634|nr:cupin domain-containing protein [Niveispirillum irakense]